MSKLFYTGKNRQLGSLQQFPYSIYPLIYRSTDQSKMDPTNACESILKNIKASNLHYKLNENQFSLQVTIRKKFIDD